MADSAGLSRHQDAAILGLIRVLQERLRTTLVDGGEVDELLKAFLRLMEVYLDEIRPALKRALAWAQQASLPSEVLDELMAADVKIHKRLEPANADLAAMIAAGADKAQIPRRSIATMEHLTDEARTLIARIEHALEEFESGRSDRS